MLRHFVRIYSGLTVGFAACSSPTQTPPIAQPAAAPTIASYVWPDSLPRYFPAQIGKFPAVVGSQADVPLKAIACRYKYEFAAECLQAFGAPILQAKKYKTGIYRFIWLRSFHRPALLTLEAAGAGGILRTQFLNKSPDMSVPTLSDANELGIGAEARKCRQEFNQKEQHDPKFLAMVALAKAPVQMIEEKRVAVSPALVSSLSNC